MKVIKILDLSKEELCLRISWSYLESQQSLLQSPVSPSVRLAR